ncbi:GLPGLI family protein [Flavobacteriaceae bacterium AU392]|nr:GLPGLI family protein [Flavobacteriaceae bacterium]RKM81551.1 GLPGLI family protein [Flavobacteriaceae bacterium AU392]
MKLTLTKLKYTFLLAFIVNISNAQKDFQGVATYESKTTIDLDNIGGGRGGRQLTEEQKKQFAERMRRNLEKTYTLRFNKTESMYKEQAKLQAPTAGGRGGRGFGGFGGSFTGGDQYKNVKDEQLLQEQEFFGKQFLIKDDLKKLEWKMENESRQIGQYLAFKATAVKKVDDADFGNFFRRGRNNNNETAKDSTATDKSEDELVKSREVVVTAWYTPQIPVNQGPGEYWGLPGLILEVSEDRTTILCSKIVINPGEKEEIKVPSKGKEVTKTEYTEIINKKMIELRENFRGRGRGGNGGGRRGGN